MLNSQAMTLNQGFSRVEKSSRSLLFHCLYRLEIGTLTLVESFEISGESSRRQQTFGSQKPEQPSAIVEVKNPALYGRILKGGSIAAAEAYMDGWWESPDLTAVMEVMALNSSALDDIEGKGTFITKLAYKMSHWLNRNTIEKASENIHAHYDLGNDLYFTFLDERMLYSSGIYSASDDTLEQAQINKMERLCLQLKLASTDHVIEIGTGWGGMAIYMAQNYGCNVTTTTISDEQYEYAQSEIKKANLENKITLLKQDYRLLEGHYDKLVSIEMIEAVGKEYLSSYLSKCQSLLKSGGLMAIQAITIADQRYDYYSNNVDFIQKYIFPGGFLPSVTALTSSATKNTDFVVRDLFDIGLDYAKTLNDWKARFDSRLDEVKELGYDERFIRMWRYYFCYCEGGFNAKSISTIHLTLERP